MQRRPPQDPVPIIFLDDEPRAHRRPEPKPQPEPQPEPVRPEVAFEPTPPRRRREWPVGTLAFLTVVGLGLLLRGHWSPRGVILDEEIRRSFAAEGHPEVIIETFNGPIEVERGAAGRVDCLVTRRVHAPSEPAARAALERVRVAIDRVGSRVRVTARPDAGRGLHGAGATVRLRVPEGAAVRLRTDNGRIRVDGVEGPVSALTANGPIEVEDAAGPVRLATANGSIDCEAERALVAAESHNGQIRFRGSLAPGVASFQSRNGSVTLRLPEDRPFRVDASTRHGQVESDFDLDAEHASRRHLVGRHGDGDDVAIEVHADHGKIRILEDD